MAAFENIRQTVRITGFLPPDLGNPADETSQHQLLVRATIVLSILGAIWGIIYIVFGEPRAGVISLSYSVLSWLDFLLYRVYQRYDFFRFNQLLLILLLPFLLLLELGGFRSSGAVILWSLTCPMGALIFTQPRYAVRWFGAFFVAVLIGAIYEATAARPSHMPSTVVTVFFLLNVNGVCLVVFALLHNFLLQKERLRAIEQAYLGQEMMLRQSEKLATLGRLSAGMAHELNNPASAVLRGAKQMQTAFTDLQAHTFDLYEHGLTQPQLDALSTACRECQNRTPPTLSTLERSDRETAIETWLAVPDAWQYADTLVELGYTPEDLKTLFTPFTMEQRPHVLAWIKATFTLVSVMEEVAQGASQITHLVKALKSYTYLDQAPIQLVDIHEGLDNTLVMLRSKLKIGVTLHKDYAPYLPRIQAYGSELNQVWTNLIDNAIDAMDGKGEITIQTTHEGRWIVVRIEDTGSGIPADVVPKVFDPFFTTKEPGKGTGLGLNISHNIIVQKHNGRISVTSQPGKTTFTVRLPGA